MSEWKKVELPPEPTPDPIPEPIPVAEEPPFDPGAELPPLIDTDLPLPTEESADTPQEPEPPVSPAPAKRRTSRRNKPSAAKSKRRNRAAAPIGFLVLVLALIGVVSVLVSGFQLLQKVTDDTPLKEELAEFLEPVMLQNPTAFEGAKEAASNTSCIKAALWQVTETERIRMRQEKAECRFSSDDNDRLLIPEKEVTEAFAALFGKDAAPDTAVFAQQKDGFAIWYDADTKQYHVPAFASSLYQPVIDTVEEQDGGYRVRVGYVAAEDIKVDDKGNDIPPTAADATVFQYYTVEESADGYRLHSIVDAVAAQ